MQLALISQYDFRYPVGVALGSRSISARLLASVIRVWTTPGGKGGMSLRSEEVTILRSSA